MTTDQQYDRANSPGIEFELCSPAERAEILERTKEKFSNLKPEQIYEELVSLRQKAFGKAAVNEYAIALIVTAGLNNEALQKEAAVKMRQLHFRLSDNFYAERFATALLNAEIPSDPKVACETARALIALLPSLNPLLQKSTSEKVSNIFATSPDDQKEKIFEQISNILNRDTGRALDPSTHDDFAFIFTLALASQYPFLQEKAARTLGKAAKYFPDSLDDFLVFALNISKGDKTKYSHVQEGIAGSLSRFSEEIARQASEYDQESTDVRTGALMDMVERLASHPNEYVRKKVARNLDLIHLDLEPTRSRIEKIAKKFLKDKSEYVQQVAAETMERIQGRLDGIIPMTRMGPSLSKEPIFIDQR